MSSNRNLVVRSFSASATIANAEAYVDFFNHRLVPQLRRIDGHRGAMVLVRTGSHQAAIEVLTFWESIEAIRRFAGEEIDRAVIEPDARALFLSCDEQVRHYHMALNTLDLVSAPSS